MSDYLKAKMTVTLSGNSDYSAPDWVADLVAYQATPEQAEYRSISAPIGAPGIPIVEADLYASVNTVIIKNEDTTNYVTIGWKSLATAAATTCRLAAKGMLVLTGDVDATVDVTAQANGAECLCKVIVSGDN